MEVAFGLKCPQCGSSSGIFIGESSLCPSCHVPMIADSSRPGWTANAYCPTCKTFAGLVNSERCSKCGDKYKSI